MIWTHAGAALLAAGLAFAAGWQVRSWKAGADEADRLELANRDAIRRANLADQAAERHEQARRAADQRAQRTREEERRVAQAPAYRAECLDDAGLRLIADDIAARRAGQPARPVPRASDPHGQDRR